jgi:CRP-like cAMP-binding protein
MLSIQEKVRFLRDIPTFDSLTAEQIEDLAALCETHTFNTSSYIFRQGDLGNSLYVIVDGRVAIEREVSSATDTVSLTIVGPHEYFGEMSLFYDVPRTVTATTMQDTVVLQIKQDAFMAFAHQNPDLLLELNQILSQRLVEAHDKIAEVTSSRKPRELQKLYEKLDF